MVSEKRGTAIEYSQIRQEADTTDGNKSNEPFVSHDRPSTTLFAMPSRSNAPYWQHDAYTLRSLERAIAKSLCSPLSSCNLGPHSTVVDFGCGDSPYREMLCSQGARYIGCDIAPGATVDLIIEDNGKVPLPDASADCVASFQVLEHVWDLDTYLGECRRLMNPNGVLILSTHGNWLYHPHPDDFRRWTRDGLTKELSSRGFSIIETHAIVGPLAWTTQFRTLAYNHVFRHLGWIGKVIAKIFCALMYARMTLEDKITPQSLTNCNAAVYLLIARRLP